MIFRLDEEPDIKSKVIDEYCRYFSQLRIYNQALMNYACDSQMTYLKWCKQDSNKSQKACEMIKFLIKTMNSFQHIRPDLLNFLEDDKLKSLTEFPTEELSEYASLVQTIKPSE